MSENSAPQNDVVNAVLASAARATLPFQQAHTDRHRGTAFWYNHLVESTPDEDIVRQYLVTAEALTRYDLAQWTLRTALCEPAMSAELLLMTEFAAGWTRFDGLGVAVLPTAVLDAHAERKGWRWTTDEITDGLAATAEDIAAIGPEPISAYVLGHDVGEVDHPGGVGRGRDERLQAVLVGAVARTSDGVVRWSAPLPEGCAGAPVFIARPLGGGRFQLICVGLVLPGEGPAEIATFDRIRTAVAEALAAEAHSGAAQAAGIEAVGIEAVKTEPAGTEPAGKAAAATTPATPRRWWQRRRT
ncbi:hypothetical protein CFP65_6156 [Kitasatospora sp. MMS16-BH015]|uniref:hypothetical protein n=1 Tax=Kitasatospora sp. MMS16-BH015 TaxID=2018025 RepID=UPI000CA38310|nr:hypothetical protein [Kitasatospora sp. MMS16-BH015]AUG80823.1 hypothetical protein CFP65_6156 [Kitasatospora sp. MMS16-BH015]